MSNRRRRTDQEIEERIVSMRFDNAQFQSASKETMKRLTELESAVGSLGNSSAGLESFDQAIRSVGRNTSLHGIANNVDDIAKHFTWWGRTVDHVTDDITSRVVRMAERTGRTMVGLYDQFFGFDPNLEGFREYENMLTSIQTIKTNTASKGTTLDEINAALADLNEYADQTIYSFQEMTKNIGTFTAAGVGLEDAVLAIKGISNLGAGVGSTPQQVANAMYQLSQALAAGKVQLQDWNSVVNAGMGGEYFQNALKDAAREVAAEKGIIVKAFEGTFRESISGGDSWITDEVLMRALTKFANDPALEEAATKVKSWTQLIDTLKESIGSGWSETWQYLFGDLDEASELFTFLSTTIDSLIKPIHDSRNSMLKFWHDYGGRDSAFRAIVNVMSTLKGIIYTIGDAWHTWFPPQTGEGLIALTERFERFTEIMRPSEEQLEKLWYVASGFFQFLRGVADIIGAVKDVVGSVVSTTLTIALTVLERILTVCGGLSDWVINFLRPLGILTEAVDDATNRLNPIAKMIYVIRDVVVALGQAFVIAGALLWDFLDQLGFGEVINWFVQMGVAAKEWLATLTAEDVLRWFDTAKKKAIQWYSELKKRFPTLQKIEDILKSNLPTLDKITSSVKEAGGVFKFLFGQLSALKNWLTEKYEWVTANAFKKNLLDLSSDIDDKLDKSSGIIEKFKIGWQAFTDFLVRTGGEVQKIVSPIWAAFGEQIKQLFAQLSNLTVYDLITLITIWEGIQFFKGLKATFTGLGDILKNVAKVVESANKIVVKFGEFVDTARGTLKAFRNKLNADAFITFALAIGLLTASIIALTMVDTSKAIPGLIALSILVVSMLAIMALLAVAAKADLEIDTEPILFFAAALGILAASLYALTNVDNPEKIITALIAVETMLLTLGLIAGALAFVNGKTGGQFKGSMLGMIGFAAALYLLVGVIRKLATDETENFVKKGVLRFGLIMLALGVFFLLAQNIGAVSISAGLGLVAAAFALTKLMDVIKILSLKRSSELGRDTWLGIGRFAVLMTILTAVFAGMGAVVRAARIGPKQIMAIGVALSLMVAGLSLLTGSLALLKDMPIESINAAANALMGILGVITIFMAATIFSDTKEVGGNILAMSVGVLAMAAAMRVMAGVPIGAMISTIVTLGVLIIAAMALGKFAPNLDKFTDAMSKFAKALVMMVVGLIGLGILFSATGPLLAIIAAGANSIVNYLAEIGIAVLSLIVMLGPPLVAAVYVLLMDFVDGISMYLPDFVDSICRLIEVVWDEIFAYAWDYARLGMGKLLAFVGQAFWDGVAFLGKSILGASIFGGLFDPMLERIESAQENMHFAYDEYEQTLKDMIAEEQKIRMLEKTAVRNGEDTSAKDAIEKRTSDFLNSFGYGEERNAIDALANGSATLKDIAGQLPTADNVVDAVANRFEGTIDLSSLTGSFDTTEFMTQMFSQEDASGFMKNLAGSTVEGWTEGVALNTSLGVESSEAFMEEMFKAMQETAKVNSPSERTIWIGEMMVEGLHISLTDGQSVVYSDGYGLGVSILAGLSDALNASDPTTFSPVISPVIDLSSSYGLGTTYQPQTLNLSTPSAPIPSMASVVADEMNVHTDASSGMNEELIGLRSDFASMADKMENLTVRLNDDTLVGAIAPKIDSELAGYQTISQRSRG